MGLINNLISRKTANFAVVVAASVVVCCCIISGIGVAIIIGMGSADDGGDSGGERGSEIGISGDSSRCGTQRVSKRSTTRLSWTRGLCNLVMTQVRGISSHFMRKL